MFSRHRGNVDILKRGGSVVNGSTTDSFKQERVWTRQSFNKCNIQLNPGEIRKSLKNNRGVW